MTGWDSFARGSAIHLRRVHGSESSNVSNPPGESNLTIMPGGPRMRHYSDRIAFIAVLLVPIAADQPACADHRRCHEPRPAKSDKERDRDFEGLIDALANRVNKAPTIKGRGPYSPVGHAVHDARGLTGNVPHCAQERRGDAVAGGFNFSLFPRRSRRIICGPLTPGPSPARGEGGVDAARLSRCGRKRAENIVGRRRSQSSADRASWFRSCDANIAHGVPPCLPSPRRGRRAGDEGAVA